MKIWIIMQTVEDDREASAHTNEKQAREAFAALVSAAMSEDGKTVDEIADTHEEILEGGVVGYHSEGGDRFEIFEVNAI